MPLPSKFYVHTQSTFAAARSVLPNVTNPSGARPATESNLPYHTQPIASPLQWPSFPPSLLSLFLLSAVSPNFPPFFLHFPSIFPSIFLDMADENAMPEGVVCEDGICYLPDDALPKQDKEEEEQQQEEDKEEEDEEEEEDAPTQGASLDDTRPSLDAALLSDVEEIVRDVGGENELGVGSQLPPFGGLTYVKGAPVDGIGAAGRGRVLVVEFWATWCPPCRRSVPHLSKLQGKYKAKKAVFLGITREARDVVDEFVAAMGANMNYNVAIDSAGEAERKVSGPLGVEGIPHAVVVNNDNEIVYSGHPMDAGFERALREACEEVAPGDQPVEIDNVHASVHCAACHIPTIVGVRYKCTACEDLNLCAACEAAHAHPAQHPLLKITHNDPERSAAAYVARLRRLPGGPAPRQQTDPQTGKAVHAGVSCDGGCGNPVVGSRYQCTVCANFDLCEACEANGTHPRDHPLLKFGAATAYTKNVHELWTEPTAAVPLADLFEAVCEAEAELVEDLEKDTDDEDKPTFLFNVKGSADHFKVRLTAQDGIIVLMAHGKTLLPADRLVYGAEVASLVNSTLKLGTLLVDHSDGEVVFKVVLPHFGSDGVPAHVRQPLLILAKTLIRASQLIFRGLHTGIEDRLSAKETYYAMFPEERKVEVDQGLLKAVLRSIISGNPQGAAMMLLQVLAQNGGEL